jgi:hypothetical protein
MNEESRAGKTMMPSKDAGMVFLGAGRKCGVESARNIRMHNGPSTHIFFVCCHIFLRCRTGSRKREYPITSRKQILRVANMFYKPGEPHNLPRDPFKACVIVSFYGRPVKWILLIFLPQPRPIGWISSVSKDNIHNLAPYSQFNNVTFGENPYHTISSPQYSSAHFMCLCQTLHM